MKRRFTGISERDVMKLPRRHFLHLAAGAAALPAMSRIVGARAYPSRTKLKLSLSKSVALVAGDTSIMSSV
jgi:polar amino acid transport system substrate-binding protein